MTNREPIIIVDDDIDDHYIFQEIILKLKIDNKIRFFRNGSEALTYLKTTKDRPFIILCDINMPEMDGLELRRQINADQYLKLKSIPFVFFTTAASPAQVNEAYDLTVQGFFIKEMSFEQTETTFKLIVDYWDRCKHPNSVQ